MFSRFLLLLLLLLLLWQSIIFIRDRNNKNQEISGYIDYAHRLKTEDFEPYFTGKRKLLPKPADLSFFNWENQMITSNNTPNYQVIAENTSGIMFKNKRDRKILNVDPQVRHVSHLRLGKMKSSFSRNQITLKISLIISI